MTTHLGAVALAHCHPQRVAERVVPAAAAAARACEVVRRFRRRRTAVVATVVAACRRRVAVVVGALSAAVAVALLLRRLRSRLRPLRRLSTSRIVVVVRAGVIGVAVVLGPLLWLLLRHINMRCSRLLRKLVLLVVLVAVVAAAVAAAAAAVAVTTIAAAAAAEAAVAAAAGAAAAVATVAAATRTTAAATTVPTAGLGRPSVVPGRRVEDGCARVDALFLVDVPLDRGLAEETLHIVARLVLPKPGQSSPSPSSVHIGGSVIESSHQFPVSAHWWVGDRILPSVSHQYT